MATVVWLLAAVGVWLATVCAICMLLTIAKRADARLHTPPRLLRELAAGEQPLTEASGLSGLRISTIVVGVRQPPLAARTTAIAAGGQAQRPPWPPSPSADLDPSSARSDYLLYMREAPVAQLHWRVGRGSTAGWYLWQRREGWRRLPVDPELDADVDPVGAQPGWHETADLAACVSTALALDAAAKLLYGPPPSPSRPLPIGRYELHASGLPAEIVPIAFPETIIARAGDVSTLEGDFDDLGLTVLTRRIAILGGRLLALFHADPSSRRRRPS